jgi:hypothetical protein
VPCACSTSAWDLVAAATEATIGALPLVQLEALVEALLAFNGLEDLAAWLE